MDVAIVGAGPAGAWAALKLASAGVRVAVFDASHPREKPCGGGLTSRAVELIVSELGFLPGPVVAVRRARFECAMSSVADEARVEDGDAAVVPLVDRGPCADSSLVVVPRTSFDRALLDAAVLAGATHVPERVIDVAAAAGGAIIRTRNGAYQACLLLGADGANSLVRRRLAGAFTRRQISLGAGYFVHGVRSSDIALRWMANPPGYMWSFPRSDHLAVGICAEADSQTGVESLRRATDRWIAAAALAPTSSRSVPYSWPIPSLDVDDFDELSMAGGRWMLLGDAAGLVDPLTREGIYYALLSGEAAAAAIVEGRWERAYRECLEDTIVPELRRAAALKRGFFVAEFSRLLVRALAESSAIRSVMVDLVAGRQPYIGLRRRLLRTLRLGWAAKVIKHSWALASC